MKSKRETTDFVTRLKQLLPRRFHNRVALLVCCLIMLFGSLQYLVHYQYLKHAQFQVRQQLNWGLAEAIAYELRPLLIQGLKNPELHKRLDVIKNQHPDMDFFLLDNQGYVIKVDHANMKGFRDKANRVPTKALKEFLVSKPSRELPLTTKDPTFPGYRQTIYSVARVEFEDQSGYLFVNLAGGEYRVVINGIIDGLLVYCGIIGSGTLWVLTAAIALLVLLALTKRLRTLSSVVSSFSQGDYAARVEVRGNDEVSDLASTFNQMADRIVHSMNDLAEADKKRRETVAHITHDLGRPIAAIQGYLETIVEDEIELTSEKRDSYLQIALKNTYSLKELVSDFFELSKLESRDILPEPEAFSLLETVTEEIIPKLTPLAKEKQVSLHAEHPQFMNVVLADVAMIERVISNLVENAIRYNQEGGEVTVNLKESGFRTSVEISDTGPGIPKEEQDHIFNRFYRGSTGREKDSRGTGLGLAIVKEILSTHGEIITVNSSPGKGSSFYFSLPHAKSYAEDKDTSDDTKPNHLKEDER